MPCESVEETKIEINKILKDLGQRQRICFVFFFFFFFFCVCVCVCVYVCVSVCVSMRVHKPTSENSKINTVTEH